MLTAKQKGLIMATGVIAFVFAWVSTPILFGWFMWADWVPTNTITAIDAGATHSQVRQMLGEPTTYRASGDWTYARPWRIAEFTVCFNENGKTGYWYYDR